MTLIRRCGWSLAVALLLACSSDRFVGPNGQFDQALAKSVCGPADGPALTIYLASNPITPSTTPAGEFVQVFIDGMSTQLFGLMLPVSTHSSASASYHWSTNETEYATSGYVKLDAGGVGDGLDGSVDLQFPDAGRVKGEFHAEWLANTGGCF
jgi:hypothetical protein